MRAAHVRTTHVVREAAFHPVAGDETAWVGESGKASFYSQVYNGRRSASGIRFDQGSMTAAHAWLPFGTKVRVVLAGTDRSVIVTITDRIYSHHRIVDLSRAAASQLGIIQRGLAEVTLNPV
ncbi:MAG TPA: septal ring lytic transglycosylase RlpA family protein [Rhodopila sp.]|nr:septal ring lytic transglycosylase RlpA family protein [Rhodopila sp.]